MLHKNGHYNVSVFLLCCGLQHGGSTKKQTGSGIYSIHLPLLIEEVLENKTLCCLLKESVHFLFIKLIKHYTMVVNCLTGIHSLVTSYFYSNLFYRVDDVFPGLFKDHTASSQAAMQAASLGVTLGMAVIGGLVVGT